MATQKGRNWSSGDIVTAANLQSIERGVSAVAEEYTPTTWANGDTVTAAALNNIEQGIANAGGSSDFSTVEVTLIGNNGSFSVYTERDEEYYPDRYQCFFRIGNQLTFDESPLAENETPLILTLYYLGNSCVCYPNNTCTSATGDVVFDSDNNTLTITGDCTITGYIAD